MIEKGISPPPPKPQIADRAGMLTPLWLKWFQRLQMAFATVATYQPTLTPASAGAGYNVQTFTVSGLRVEDAVVVNPPRTANVYLVEATVTDEDELTLVFYNATGGALTPAAGTYRIVAIRN